MHILGGFGRTNPIRTFARMVSAISAFPPMGGCLVPPAALVGVLAHV